MNFFKKLLLNGKKIEDINKLRKDVVSGKKKDTKLLRRLNKKFSIILDQGSIEITIKQVKGVLEELR